MLPGCTRRDRVVTVGDAAMRGREYQVRDRSFSNTDCSGTAAQATAQTGQDICGQRLRGQLARPRLAPCRQAPTEHWSQTGQWSPSQTPHRLRARAGTRHGLVRPAAAGSAASLGSLGSRGAKTRQPRRGRGSLRKRWGRPLHPKAVIRTSALGSNHHHRCVEWIDSPLDRKHWAQIYVKCVNNY